MPTLSPSKGLRRNSQPSIEHCVQQAPTSTKKTSTLNPILKGPIMRIRFRLVLAALFTLSVFFLAGCGDKSTPEKVKHLRDGRYAYQDNSDSGLWWYYTIASSSDSNCCSKSASAGGSPFPSADGGGGSYTLPRGGTWTSSRTPPEEEDIDAEEEVDIDETSANVPEEPSLEPESEATESEGTPEGTTGGSTEGASGGASKRRC